jgi:phytoene/squalene synthetase
LATRFLPCRKRNAVEAVYAVFRVADDVADLPLTRAEHRDGALASIAYTIAHIRDSDCVIDAPWFPAASEAFLAYPIEIGDALRLITACRAEVKGFTCRTMDELESYAENIGGAVMRIAVAILGTADAETLAAAERLGIAIQLTDVLRDVEEDRRNGRSYLPAEFASLPDRGLAKILEKTHHFYRNGERLAQRLPNDGSRLTILLVTEFYEALLEGRLSWTKRLRLILRPIGKSYSSTRQKANDIALRNV